MIFTSSILRVNRGKELNGVNLCSLLWCVSLVLSAWVDRVAGTVEEERAVELQQLLRGGWSSWIIKGEEWMGNGDLEAILHGWSYVFRSHHGWSRMKMVEILTSPWHRVILRRLNSPRLLFLEAGAGSAVTGEGREVFYIVMQIRKLSWSNFRNCTMVKWEYLNLVLDQLPLQIQVRLHSSVSHVEMWEMRRSQSRIL